MPDEKYKTLTLDLTEDVPPYSTEALILNLLPEIRGDDVAAESGMSVADIAKGVGKSKATVAAKLLFSAKRLN